MLLGTVPPARHRNSFAASAVALASLARDGFEHVRLVRRWAETTWEAWSSHHAQVREWAAEALDARR